MRTLLVLLTIFGSSCFCYSQPPASKNIISYSYKIFNAKEQTYGYDIYQGKTRYIHQATIPSVNGDAGFSSKEKAARAARLIIEKLKAGIFPPSVSAEELKKIKAI